MNRARPRLKNGVDLQLQSAFQDGNWPVVARLAEKRARTTGDSYYEIVRVCAESQADEPSARFVAVQALWQYVQDGTVVKDADGVDLLEWAAQDLLSEDDYQHTLGPLRVRSVKAAPKDSGLAGRCLESCLLHWDLNSAQQIAAIMDRSFPQERGFMFRNIVITHMLSTSPQSPPEKKKLYGMLAQKQIERAAQSTEQAQAENPTASAPDRGIQTEEEILLLYDIVFTHGSAADLEKLIASPVFSPLAQFRQGRKELFRRVAAKHEKDGDWEAVFRLCHDCLSQTDESGQPGMLASDWVVWQQFITAAGHMRLVDEGTQQKVQELLLKVLKSPNLRPLYKRNLYLARVLATFTLAPNNDGDVKDGQPSSLRLRELVKYIDDQAANPSCFDDIKGFLEKLDADGMRMLAFDYLPKVAKDGDDAKSARIQLLSLKAQYFVSSCPLTYTNLPGEKPKRQCGICSTESESTSCYPCLSAISRKALDLFKSISNDSSKFKPTFKDEILPDVAILIAYCSVRQAFPGHKARPLSSTSTRHVLSALFILEHQLFNTPKHSVLSLLIVQLHLLLGSGYRAREVWDVLGIKRTIVDSLGALLYDRFSTIAPSALSRSDKWGRHLMDTLKTHYEYSLKLRMPHRLIDAFEDGSYNSVMEIPRYIENLRFSGARVMSLVEQARTERLLGSPMPDFLSDPRFAEIEDDRSLTETIDYGSFPSWVCSESTPHHALLQLGPPPSNRRSHLSLFAEAFHDIMAYKPPAIYKAPAAAPIDQTFVLESLSQLSNSMNKFLPGAEAYCTASELLYFETISILSVLIPHCTGPDRSTAVELTTQLADAAKSALDSLRLQVQGTADNGIEHTVATLASMHQMTILRDTAAATKLATQYLHAFNEREKIRDRSGSSNLPKDLVVQIKILQTTADAALKDGKSWMMKLQGDLSKGDFEKRLRAWVFEDADGVGSVVEDGTVGELVASWKMGVKGWGQVKWE